MSPSRSSSAGAVVVGGYVNALQVVRSLGSRGLPVVVVGTAPFDIAQHSRHCSGYHALSAREPFSGALLDLLAGRSAAWDGWLVLPTNDEALEVLSRHRDELERSYRLLAPPWDVARRLLHKDDARAEAAALGIDVPRSCGPADRRTAAREDLPFPVVVKPDLSHRFARHFGRKLFVAEDRESLRSAVERLEAAGLSGQIQELVPGGDDCFYNVAVYRDRRGATAGLLSMHKLRKSPPFYGVCRVAETCDLEELFEPTVELLRRVGFTGMANAEYKRDPRDGRYRLMEVNGRPFLMQGLARRAGIDLPDLAWRERVRGETVRGRTHGWRGAWIHLHADLLHAALFHRTEGLRWRDYAAPYRGPHTFAVWDPSDPRPFAVQWARSLRDAGRAAAEPGRRAALRARVDPLPEAARMPAYRPARTAAGGGVLGHLGRAGGCIRLGLRFDAEALAAEIEALPGEVWEASDRNPAVQASTRAFYALGDRWPAGSGRERPVLARMPRLRRLLREGLPARPRRVIVARLPAGGFIPYHNDRREAFRSTLRVLLPVTTNPGVRIVADGLWYRPQAGEAWSFDNLTRHGVVNDGATERIFLLCDCEATPELCDRIRRGERLAGVRDPRAAARHWLRSRLRYARRFVRDRGEHGCEAEAPEPAKTSDASAPP